MLNEPPLVIKLAHHNVEVPGLVQLYVRLQAEAVDPDHPCHEYFLDRDVVTHSRVTRGIERRQMKPCSILLTLDPAAAYAGLLAKRDDVVQAVAHPCHPSVFLERTAKEEWADTFGGQGAPQNVVAAIDEDAPAATRDAAEATIRTIYAPVIDVHWVTVKQLAILEPTLVETVACMIGTLLNEAPHETVHTAGVPEEAAKAMLFGHVQIALTNALRGSNPFSEACEIAIQYGKDTIIKDDWKKIFDDS
ncbi:hypothetical protein OOZ51_16155 [Arthrobacter sp. MI7-26]|nr:hypothetical protein [Arthrobacter sp. MI7-26]